MDDRALVAALRARDPSALVALYDDHAEGLHEFCLFALGGIEAAQVALRDTLIAAEAHIHALADPGRLRVWLYALARGECRRRKVQNVESLAFSEMSLESKAPEIPDLVGIDAADLRLMAWNAVWSLTPADREILVLATRQALTVTEIALVTATSPRNAQARLAAAHEHLRDAVTAEILARKGPCDCPARARVLYGFTGELTAAMRADLITHLKTCLICSPHPARRVSAAKVFALLPAPVFPATLRVRIMSCFADPELLPYRRHIARRVGVLDAAGFPVSGIKGNRRWARALAGMAAVASAAMITLAFVYLQDVEPVPTGGTTRALPTPGVSSATGTARQRPEPRRMAVRTEPAPGNDRQMWPLEADRSVVVPLASLAPGDPTPPPPTSQPRPASRPTSTPDTERPTPWQDTPKPRQPSPSPTVDPCSLVPCATPVPSAVPTPDIPLPEPSDTPPTPDPPDASVPTQPMHGSIGKSPGSSRGVPGAATDSPSTSPLTGVSGSNTTPADT